MTARNPRPSSMACATTGGDEGVTGWQGEAVRVTRNRKGSAAADYELLVSRYAPVHPVTVSHCHRVRIFSWFARIRSWFAWMVSWFASSCSSFCWLAWMVPWFTTIADWLARIWSSFCWLASMSAWFFRIVSWLLMMVAWLASRVFW